MHKMHAMKPLKKHMTYFIKWLTKPPSKGKQRMWNMELWNTSQTSTHISLFTEFDSILQSVYISHCN